MSAISRRLARRINRDFAISEQAQQVCDLVAQASDSERVQAAIVLAAHGDINALHAAIDLAALDWRDVLMASGLGHQDWKERMNVALDSPRSPRRWRSRRKLTMAARGGSKHDPWAMNEKEVKELEEWLQHGDDSGPTAL